MKFNVEFEFVLSHIIEKYTTYIKVTFNFAHNGKKKTTRQTMENILGE